MSKKLYAGNLPHDIDEGTLNGLFVDGGCPTDEVAIIMDPLTGCR